MTLFGFLGKPDAKKSTVKSDLIGLIKALNYHKDPNVRGDAAEGLRTIGDAHSVNPLIDTLKDENEDVCTATTQALGKIGDARVVNPLITVLKDNSSSGVYQCAVIALSSIGDIYAVSSLISVLKDNTFQSDIRYAATDAPGNIGLSAVDPLISALKDNDEVVRTASIQALFQIGYPAVNKLLFTLT